MGGLFGGGSSAPSNSSSYAGYYVPQNAPTADADWLSLFNNLQNNNVAQQLYPQISTAAQGIVNNPYAASAQTAAGTAGQAYTNTGNTDIASAAGLNTAGTNALPLAQQALTQGFDPQSSLYNLDLGNLTNQINAENSAAGIGTSPVGAQIAGNTLGNFGINWNAQQLANEGTAANTANTIASGANADILNAANLGNTGAAALNQGGQLPYTQYGTNLSNELNALNTQSAAGTAANANTNQALGDITNYLGLTNQAFSGADTAANNNFLSTLAGATAAGTGVSDLANLFSGTGGTAASAYDASSPAAQVASDVAAGDSTASSGGLLDTLASFIGS